jgi:hypothetical protein
LQGFKLFASEFYKAIKYNRFEGLYISKIDFAKILIDLGFIHAAKLKINYHIEFALSLPMVNILWNILINVLPHNKR